MQNRVIGLKQYLITKFMRNGISHFCGLHIAQMLLYTLVANLVIAQGLFMVGKTISWIVLPLSIMVSVFVLVLFYGESVNESIVYEVIISFAIILVLSYLSGKIYDQSWDGNTYQKPAIGLLYQHWNPIYTQPGEKMLQLFNNTSGGEKWVECYCKAPWIYAASVYAMTGNIECGKSYTAVAMVIVFLMTYNFLLVKKRGKTTSAIFSIVATFNPIVIQQIDTFYVDGYLHLMLYMLVLSLWLLSSETEYNNIMIASIAASSMIVCGNIKFTGLLYGGAFCVAYYIWYCLTHLKMGKKTHHTEIVKTGVLFATLALFTVGFAGFSPYLTNVIRYGSPTYPLTGNNSVDIISHNSPFLEENRLKNLFISLFSKMNDTHRDNYEPQKLKIPFSIDWEAESKFLATPDARISGFGLLFSGILLIAIISIVICIFKNIPSKKVNYNWFILATCIILTFSIKESWWARYSPYLFFLVLMALCSMLFSDVIFFKRIGILYACLILINSAFYITKIPQRVSVSKIIEMEMAEMRKEELVHVTNSVFSGVYFNMLDRGVRFTVEDQADAEEKTMTYLGIKWKAND